jgi:hypothetical protein
VQLQLRGLVKSEREFSLKWLGRSANYACESRLTDVSPATILKLVARLREESQLDLESIAIDGLLQSSR